jgi:hypothetical protein
VSEHTERDSYDIEKQIYQTQWANIRHHWDKTFAGVTYLSTLIALAVVPLKFLRVSEGGIVELGVDDSVSCYVKVFVAAVILLLGVVTFLNQYNHFMRSRQARKVVVAIEKKWGLYDKEGDFIFQDKHTKYAYSKFAGGEKRLTYSQVQFAYIVVITVAALVFVAFA